ncbi:insulinase family protein [Sphingomonas sp. RB56-2]|uniref:Insulinase family protein n=1 Tax=Sphingomonas brevis TaxID=2908206 RepID=A0ABT0SBH0_9SPHN|nr:pitrilysin family protein [Sphingomonas brevis]MCL6741760.1 insulinase family protein [Sphingomonas brevis]
MAELTRLSNGLTVAIDPMPGAQSAAIGLHAFVGSRSEADGKGGLAHLVEHMVFKGARGRDARAIAEAIEDVGGTLNAWTSRDQTSFHARTLAPDVGLALELIADLVRAPKLDESELEREKLVILSELGECLDAPDDLIHDRLFEAAFGDQPLARSVLGNEGTIQGLGRADCVQWLAEQYRPDRLVISAAGKVDAGHVLLLAEALFGDLETRAAPKIAPASFLGGTRSDRRPAEQTHLALAFPGLPASDPGAPALSLFAQAVGGGMSSRLFQELREERGLAYSIYAWTQGFADTGLFAINLAADKARATEALNLALAAVNQAAVDLSDAELKRARAQVEAAILMALETPQGRADAMARSIEIFGRIMTVEEMLAELRAVDASAAREAGAAMLAGPRAIASIGGKLALAA